ncbi:hypothetical protein N9937_00605 [bacterium]|nr:hypothetical protein [bacterium]
MAIVSNLSHLLGSRGKPVMFYANDARTWTFHVTKANGDDEDISSWTPTLRLNSDGELGSGTNKIFEKAGTLKNGGTSGRFTVVLGPNEVSAAHVGYGRNMYLLNTASGQYVVAHVLVNVAPNPLTA